MIFAGVLSAGLVGLGALTWQNLALGGSVDWSKINKRQMVYLSDLEYDSANSRAEVKAITKYKNWRGDKISLMVDGNWKEFSKGLFAHAESVLEYDLSKLQFDYLEGYFGIDFRAGDGDGVIFSVEVLPAGQNQFQTVATSPRPVNWKNTEYHKIDIRGVQRLRLRAGVRGNNNNDWAVYAGAKLTKASYTGKNVDVQTIAEYDQSLAAAGSTKAAAETQTMAVLKRELVRRIGYDDLQEMAAVNEHQEAALNWLLSDINNLRDYLVGGEVEGSYGKSLEWLGKLLAKHQADLANQQTTALGVKKRRFVPHYDAICRPVSCAGSLFLG